MSSLLSENSSFLPVFNMFCLHQNHIPASTGHRSPAYLPKFNNNPVLHICNQPLRTIPYNSTDMDGPLSISNTKRSGSKATQKDLHKDCTFSLSKDKILFEGTAKQGKKVLPSKYDPKARRLAGRVGHR